MPKWTVENTYVAKKRIPRFVNLHHHSTFSFGDGFGTPAQHVARAAELGYGAIALTEHGNVSSHFQLEKAAMKAGIKPIFGLEAYCGSVELDTRQQFKNHLTIIAQNLEGYRGLNRIVTQSYLDYYYHPTVSGASLALQRSGLVVLSGCSGSLLACSLLGGKGIPVPESRDGYAWDDARLVIEQFRRVFGSGYYLEVQHFHELEVTAKLNKAYARFSKEYDIPLVVTGDVHYPNPDEGEMQAVLHAVHRGHASVDDAMRQWNYEVPMTLPESDGALAYRLGLTGLTHTECWEAIEMTGVIADSCNVTLPKAERLLYPATDKDLEPWTT
jgi:DNA polymerase III subunit alpha